MNANEFKSALQRVFKESNEDIEFYEAKRNGKIFHGVVFSNKSSPIVYYDKYLESTTSIDVKFVAKELINELHNYQKEFGKIDIDEFVNRRYSREYILEHVTVRAVARKGNEEFLAKAVHVPYPKLKGLELYFVLVFDVDGNSYTLRLQENHLRNTNITVKELKQAAKKNSEISVHSLESTLGFEVSDFNSGYVITSNNDVDSSGILFVKDSFKEIAKAVGDSYVLIPSSIYEWLAFKCDDSFSDMEYVSNFVYFQNKNLHDNEKLIDGAYLVEKGCVKGFLVEEPLNDEHMFKGNIMTSYM